MILVSFFFQKTMFYLMKLKYAIFFNIKVTKSSIPLFGGHPVYTQRREIVVNISANYNDARTFYTIVHISPATRRDGWTKWRLQH